MAYTVNVAIVGLPTFVQIEDVYLLGGSFETYAEAFEAGKTHVEELGRPPGGAIIQIIDASGATIARDPDAK